MHHLALEDMRRLLGGQGGSEETEEAAEHWITCSRCRAQAGTILEEFRGARADFQLSAALQLVAAQIDRERKWGLDALTAIAEWAELRCLPTRRSQRDRVRMAKGCHTMAFFNIALGALKEESSWEEVEFMAGLALLSLEAMSQRQLIRETRRNDRETEVWAAVANSRRRAAEWERAHQALAHAELHRKKGTGDARVGAGLLSIVASTLADEGHIAEALEALEQSRAVYQDLSEGTLLARTLVQKANILAGVEPAVGLAALDHADPLIPTDDRYLNLLAELLRVECLIELQRPNEALQAFRRCYSWLGSSAGTRMTIRGSFTGARLLDALGLQHQAERLFDDVIEKDIENELYKDAFLDLLYLYGRHVKAGDLEKAARVCQRALSNATLAEIAHEQLQDLWRKLLEAAQSQAVHQDVIPGLRQYLNVHWKHPAAKPPL